MKKEIDILPRLKHGAFWLNHRKSCTFAKRKCLKNENMTVQEYVEAHGYKVSDLTKKELKEVEKELQDIENGYEILDGFFSPMSAFTQRMIQQ